MRQKIRTRILWKKIFATRACHVAAPVALGVYAAGGGVMWRICHAALNGPGWSHASTLGFYLIMGRICFSRRAHVHTDGPFGPSGECPMGRRITDEREMATSSTRSRSLKRATREEETGTNRHWPRVKQSGPHSPIEQDPATPGWKPVAQWKLRGGWRKFKFEFHLGVISGPLTYFFDQTGFRLPSLSPQPPVSSSPPCSLMAVGIF